MIAEHSAINHPEEHSFFLFINSGSGGGIGTKLVNQEVHIHIFIHLDIENIV